MKIQKKTVGREKSKNGKNLRKFTYLLVKFRKEFREEVKIFAKLLKQEALP